MKKKSLSLLIAVAMATTMVPSTMAFADTTAPVEDTQEPTYETVTEAPASTYAVTYDTHIQKRGWDKSVKVVTGDQEDMEKFTDAGTSGTVGKALRVEALKLKGTNLPEGASIEYRVHQQTFGWSDVAKDGAEAGVTGKGKRAEAVQITLKGMPGYAIKYQVHVQSKGWMDPVVTENGTEAEKAAVAGTTGESKRIEAIRIQIVKTDEEKTAEVAAINAVAKAEATKTAEDIEEAKKAVAAVQDATVKSELTEKIDGMVVVAGDVKVSEVAVTSDTKVQVILTEAPEEEFSDDDADKFVIKVDEKEVKATEVVKVANKDKVYNLTIPTLDGKEGQLSVNGVAAKVSGTDFGYDFKAPEIETVKAVDKDHVKVTFSEKLDPTTANNEALYDITDVGTDTTLTVVKASLLEDGKSVLLTITTPMVTFANGYIAKSLPGMIDLVGNTSTEQKNIIFDGIGTEATEGPVALSALYESNATKVITITFDKEIGSTCDKTKIKVGGISLDTGDTVARDTDTSKLKITLSAETAEKYEAAADQNVTLEAGAVVDSSANTNGNEVKTIEVVQAAKLSSSTYNEETNELVLNFTSPVNVASFDLTKVTVNGKALDVSGQIAEAGYSSTLTVDISGCSNFTNIESALENARALVITASPSTDINGNAVCSGTYTSVFTYTDDVTAPVLKSAKINATNKEMEIEFSEPVSLTTDTMVEVDYDGEKLFDLSSLSVTYGAKIIKVSSMSGEITTIRNAVKDPSKLTVKVLKTTSSGIEAVIDEAGNKFSADADAEVNVKYVDQDPVSYSASATNLAPNQVKVTFNKVIPATYIKESNFTVAKYDESQYTIPVKAVSQSADGLSVILTLDETSTNYVNGYTYSVLANVKDIFGNSSAGGNTFILNTSQSAVGYTLSAVAYEDTTGDYTINKGDKITLTFSGNVSLSGDVVADEFTISAGNDLGTNFKVAQGSQSNQLVITLGKDPTITFNNTIDINDGAAEKHIVGDNTAKVVSGSAQTISPIDDVDPTITKAVYKDEANDGIIGEGDTVTLTFSETLKELGTVTASDFALSANNIDIKSASLSSDGKTVTLVLGSGTNDFVPGTDEIDINTTTSIKDLWGNDAAASTSVVIEKSDIVAPTLSSVSFVKGDGNDDNVTVQVGDKLVITVSEAVNDNSLSTGKPFVVYQGATPIIIDLTKASLDLGSDNKTITITLASGDGVVGKAIASLNTLNVDASVADSLTDANGNILAPSKGFGLDITK